MPRPSRLIDQEIVFNGPYYPSAPTLLPSGLENIIYRGRNVWRDPGGRIRPANGVLQESSTNVGPRIFAADVDRLTIAGSMIGDRPPHAGALRLDNACLFFVSEDTSAQVFLNESSLSGVTTSSTSRRPRVAVPDGVGGYSTFDTGFDKPLLTSASVSTVANAGLKSMTGAIGVAIAPWRSSTSGTNAIGPPSDIFYQSLSAASNSFVRVDLPTAVSGQDGWVLCGTRWNDRSGQLRAVRYVYLTPRGTFTATNGSTTLGPGVGTSWTRDLQRGDLMLIDGGSYGVISVESDTSCTIGPAFTGLSGGGKTATITDAAGDWFDGELDIVISKDIIRPPNSAGVLSYANRIVYWGCFGGTDNPTGPLLFAGLQSNPEHVGIRGIRTASGGDLVNVLGGDGPLYLMTTRGLEVVSFTGDPDTPYIPRVIASPGFKAFTNGILNDDVYYGFNRRPLRTRAEENIDVRFARDVWSDMDDWNPERVMLATDPVNQAVLYMHDDGETTEVIPWMTQQEQWGPPITLTARVLDSAVVDGELYVTYYDGVNIRVNRWEGGAGIGGDPYVSGGYIDPNFLRSNRIKGIVATGKVASASIFAVTPDAALPDVTNLAQAAVTFTQSDTDIREPEDGTNVGGDAFAFRVDFSNGGHLDKLAVSGLPRSQRR